MAGKFTRFSEKRDTMGTDVTTYDDAVEGIEPEESSGLHIPIAESNVGFRLVQKMGWKLGTGLGRRRQGRTDPVPLELKDDFMGIGRFQHELDLAVEATEKRKQMEIEKELTPGLIHRYKSQAEKEKQIAESTSDLRQSYYCELCDKQYNKYSEYDNHLNSYDHHHRQRLKSLREYEVGRKFSSHRNPQDATKLAAAQMVALERAQMRAERQLQSGSNPGFKPMGYRHSKSNPSPVSPSSSAADISTAAINSALRKRSGEEIVESEKKIAEKKARLEKYGVKFQSAGHLATINESEDSKLSSYQTIIFNASNSEKEECDNGSMVFKDSKSQGLYGGRFVSSSNKEANKVAENEKEKEEERDKRLSLLPLAKGRKAEQSASIEAEDSDDEDFVFGHRKVIQSEKPKVKMPVKQMALKLTAKYESYYH